MNLTMTFIEVSEFSYRCENDELPPPLYLSATKSCLRLCTFECILRAFPFLAPPSPRLPTTPQTVVKKNAQPLPLDFFLMQNPH